MSTPNDTTDASDPEPGSDEYHDEKDRAAYHVRNAEAELDAAEKANPERAHNPQCEHLRELRREAGETAEALEDQADGGPDE